MCFFKRALGIVFLFTASFIMARDVRPKNSVVQKQQQVQQPAQVQKPAVVPVSTVVPVVTFAELFTKIKTMPAAQVISGSTINAGFMKSIVENYDLSDIEKKTLLQAGVNRHAIWSGDDKQDKEKLILLAVQVVRNIPQVKGSNLDGVADLKEYKDFDNSRNSQRQSVRRSLVFPMQQPVSASVGDRNVINKFIEDTLNNKMGTYFERKTISQEWLMEAVKHVLNGKLTHQNKQSVTDALFQVINAVIGVPLQNDTTITDDQYNQITSRIEDAVISFMDKLYVGATYVIVPEKINSEKQKKEQFITPKQKKEQIITLDDVLNGVLGEPYTSKANEIYNSGNTIYIDDLKRRINIFNTGKDAAGNIKKNVDLVHGFLTNYLKNNPQVGAELSSSQGGNNLPIQKALRDIERPKTIMHNPYTE